MIQLAQSEKPCYLRHIHLRTLVGKVGIEPTRLLSRQILSLLCLPISPYPRKVGARGGNRTHTKADNLSERDYKSPLHPMHTRITYKNYTGYSIFKGRCFNHRQETVYHTLAALSSGFFFFLTAALSFIAATRTILAERRGLVKHSLALFFVGAFCCSATVKDSLSCAAQSVKRLLLLSLR